MYRVLLNFSNNLIIILLLFLDKNKTDPINMSNILKEKMSFLLTKNPPIFQFNKTRKNRKCSVDRHRKKKILKWFLITTHPKENKYSKPKQTVDFDWPNWLIPRTHTLIRTRKPNYYCLVYYIFEKILLDDMMHC